VLTKGSPGSKNRHAPLHTREELSARQAREKSRQKRDAPSANPSDVWPRGHL